LIIIGQVGLQIKDERVGVLPPWGLGCKMDLVTLHHIMNKGKIYADYSLQGFKKNQAPKQFQTSSWQDNQNSCIFVP
jgi:hypothetical protein